MTVPTGPPRWNTDGITQRDLRSVSLTSLNTVTSERLSRSRLGLLSVTVVVLFMTCEWCRARLPPKAAVQLDDSTEVDWPRVDLGWPSGLCHVHGARSAVIERQR